MATFLHVFIKAKTGILDDKVKEKMDLAVDWYRYADYCWVVKTTSDLAKWQTRLKPLVAPGGNLLIFQIDPSKRQGWMPKEFWAWLRKE